MTSGRWALADRLDRETLTESGARKLAALCGALWPGSAPGALEKAFEQLVRPWGDRPIRAFTGYRSNIADDEAPFEFCMAFSRAEPEVQFYVEPQAAAPSLHANMLEATAQLRAAAEALDAPLDSFRAIEDIFLPARPRPPFTLWIGASWTPERPLLLKIYLNPQVCGRDQQARVVGDALRRLGFARAWAEVEPALSLGDGRNELGIVSLDLSNHPPRRVKVYVRHRDAELAELAAVARLTGEHSRQEVEMFYTTLAGHPGPYRSKPVITEIAFAEPQTDHPSAVTLECPIGSYVEDDELARERVERCLSSFGLDHQPYRRAIAAFAERPLGARGGMHAHVTLRRVADGPRVAVYLSSEAYLGQRTRE